MLTNKTIEIIRICMNTTLAITKGNTGGAIKARQDINNAISEFNDYICDLEDEMVVDDK